MTLDPTAAAGLQAPSAASEPEWVRRGSAEVQRDYALGLQFEKMLANQLASSLAQSAGLGGEEGGESEEGSGGFSAGAGSSVLGSMLPEALATGVTANGGLGLAAELARDMQGPAGGRTQTSAVAPAQGNATGLVAGGTPPATTGGTGA